ncbi:tetratricopeptide repeat protein [Candidatus Methylomirabilis sp.]|uniref:tetratricopeptide repeat protein n=1 Tax=Candidatus Methylomirabilis sp. TaxID=2032687 RepID=UPI002A6079C6|nr:tetratricopeptide repeat protein [Candidatus Methylomirabilis sp.]
MAAAAAAIYANALGNGFVGDDYPMILRDPRIRDLKNIPSFFIPPVASTHEVIATYGYRVTIEIAHTIDYWLFGLEPWGYHATNILFHIVASTLAFLIATRLLGKLLPALFVGLLFAVHPSQTEAVAYVTGRNDELYSIFYLAGFYSFLRYREQPSRHYLIGLVSAFVLSLLSKEAGVTLPLTLLVFDSIMGLTFEDHRQGPTLRDWRQSLRASWYRFRPLYLMCFFLAGIFAYYVVAYSAASGKKEFWGGGLGPTLLTSARIHLHHMMLVLFPATLSADYSYNAFPVSSTIFDPVGLITVVAVATILYGLIRLARVSRVATFGGLWFFITLLPVSQLVPHHILMADRHLYLPSFGLFLMAGVLVDRLHEHGRARQLLYTCTAAVLLILSARTVVRNRDWRDDFTLSSKTVQTSPQSALAHVALGEILRRRGRLDQAEREFRTALGIHPSEPKAHAGMGALLAMRKQWAEAERELKMAMELNPLSDYGHLELGRLYQLQDRWTEAEAELKRAVQLWPNFDEAHLNLGLVYLNQGRLAEAEREVWTALEITPRLADAHLALGRIALQGGRTDEALAHFQTSVKLKPDNAFARNNLGVLYIQMGQIEPALEEFQAALRITPNFVEARDNLCRLYLRQGRVANAEALCPRQSH